MHIQVDQSGKIGDTKIPTVLAFSNDTNFAILITASTKRACLQELRRRGKSGTTLYLQMCSVGLYFLLKNNIQELALVTIDMEYPGHNAKIKEHLLNLLRRAGIATSPVKITFGYIGKKSGAHKQAKAVFIGKSPPDKVIRFKEIMAEFKK